MNAYSPLRSLILWLDDLRLRGHFWHVQRTLRARDVRHLPPALQQARARNLDVLHDYAVQRIFPRNHEHSGWTPCFIDRDNRLCAVAHLMIESGETKAAYHIAEVAKYAYVPEMNFPELERWAGQSGLSKDELAFIQPSYVPPELRDQLPLLSEFTMVAVRSAMLVFPVALVGMITSAVNIARGRHLKRGYVGVVIGIIIALILAFLVYRAYGIALEGELLLAPFASLRPPMIDFEISSARMGAAMLLVSLTMAIVVAVLSLAVSLWRVMRSRQAGQKMASTPEAELPLPNEA